MPEEKRQILAYCMRLKDKFIEIRTVIWSTLRHSRKARSVSAYALGLGFIAFGAVGVVPEPDLPNFTTSTTVEELALPDVSAQIAKLSPDSQQFIAEERVRSGDSLGALLERLGVDDQEAANFIRNDTVARNLIHLRPGRVVRATVNGNGKLLSATTLYADGKASTKKIRISRTNDGFSSMEMETILERRTEMRSGEIRSTLFAATDSAQIPDSVAMQLVDIFSYDIDFASELRRGDRFNVIYETLWQEGEFVRTGRILGAEFRNGNKTLQAIWFGDQDNSQGGYYDTNGKSLKKVFLKSPLEFSRVTSGFSLRVHPISGLWKQHKGIDFAAPIGTPIRSVGDGVIDFAGNQGGYGNMIVVQHGGHYSTAYAHMSSLATGMRKGVKVSRGDVIGYVGTTGWSTGPHLHYEFRVSNEARNPNSVVMPEAPALTGNDLQNFHATASTMAHRFALLMPRDERLASR